MTQVQPVENTTQSGKWKAYLAYKDSGVEWLGKIPEHWEVKRLKDTVTACQNGIWGDEPTNDASDVVCIRIADFDRTRNRVNDTNLTLRSIPSGQLRSKILKRGDLLLEKSGGGELQPVGVVVLYDLDTLAVCSNFIARMPVTAQYDTTFLCYFHSSLYAIRLNTCSIKQNTGIQNLDSYAYLCEKVSIPPLSEQHAIATFLDRETAKINNLIAKKERLIELLREKRTALISYAVTKGLDPTVKMKDSGVEWIGEIPEHWEVKRLKFLISFLTSGSRGWAQYYSDDGAIFLRIGNLSRDSINVNLDDVQRVSPPNGTEGIRTQVQKNDVLISITAYIGSIAVISEEIGEAYVNQHLALTRPRSNIINSKWLGYYLLSNVGQDQFHFLLNGGTKDGLGLDDIANLTILMPTLTEQHTLAAYLDEETSKIDALITRIEEGIEKLKEYNSAVISAAVTGKIDVRGVADDTENFEHL